MLAFLREYVRRTAVVCKEGRQQELQEQEEQQEEEDFLLGLLVNNNNTVSYPALNCALCCALSPSFPHIATRANLRTNGQLPPSSHSVAGHRALAAAGVAPVLGILEHCAGRLLCHRLRLRRLCSTQV